MIRLVNDSGYKWIHSGSIHFKGYFILKGDKTLHVYRNFEACDVIKNLLSFEQFVDFLKGIYGLWSIVIDRGNSVWMSVDVARSMPLFYSDDGTHISDSAEQVRLSLNIPKESVNRDCLLELYANYYLFGHKTVYDQICQLDLGEAVEIKDNKKRIEKYFYHVNRIDDIPESEIIAHVEDVAYNVFMRLKAVIGDRPVVLSMSGGYDSRFVGCMLKKVGITDVCCYTYGKKDNFEVSQSKHNAEALGFKWICVELTDELQKRNLDEVGLKYLDSYEGHDFTAYMQNFAAVRKLHEDGLLKPNSVILTGLCGDMPTGRYTTEFDKNAEYNAETVAARLYNIVFDRYNIPEQKKKYWIDDVAKQIKQLPIQISDHQSWQTAFDAIYTGSCHAHYFIHQNSVHSFFGYEWLLPWWDSDFLKVWYSIPVKYKYRQNLYVKWIMQDVFAPYGLSQIKYVSGYSSRQLIRKLQYFIGGVINYILLHVGIPFKRKADFSNFAPFELELYRSIKNRQLINYRRAGMMELLDMFLVERRYGADNLKYVKENTISKE